MSIIINEVEVIAPPPSRQDQRQTAPENLPTVGPTPRDIYWVNRQLTSRKLRLQAR